MHVEKEKVRVTLVLDRFLIVGNMHRYPGARLMDLLKKTEHDFLPITEAEVYSFPDDKLLRSVQFLSVNIKRINFIYPVGED